MINIQVDLGGIPESLSALQRPAVLRRAVFAMAESYVDDTLDFIEANRAFKNRTGQLSQSIGWLPQTGASAKVYANAEHAVFVEKGTRPHVIEPKERGGLTIPVAVGGYIVRGRVNHPGSRPYPFFFTDDSNRKQNMTNRAMSVIASATVNS